MPSFYEFFAGGGMARAGLGEGWQCLFANDIDEKKASSYATNWGREGLKIEDVARLTPGDLPERADLAWASFPCQDLSLAGAYAGLSGERSGTFWPFWRLIECLAKEGREPSLIVLENVCGALTSHDGKDFSAIGDALTRSGYRFGAVVIDAVRFVPQSRPRLFIIGLSDDRQVPLSLVEDSPNPAFHPSNLVGAYERLSARSKAAWIWWHLPSPPPRNAVFADLIDENSYGIDWHTADETRRLLSLMTPLHRRKVAKAKKMGRKIVGGVYKRTRVGPDGERGQRAEVRFDDVAGCLRTPVGGSSRQSIIVVDGTTVRSRLLSPREAARLMGLDDSYILPDRYNDAYHLVGDGVVVPVVRFLAEHILEPLLAAPSARNEQAA